MRKRRRSFGRGPAGFSKCRLPYEFAKSTEAEQPYTYCEYNLLLRDLFLRGLSGDFFEVDLPSGVFMGLKNKAPLTDYID
jgi:hypothetical protein